MLSSLVIYNIMGGSQLVSSLIVRSYFILFYLKSMKPQFSFESGGINLSNHYRNIILYYVSDD